MVGAIISGNQRFWCIVSRLTEGDNHNCIWPGRGDREYRGRVHGRDMLRLFAKIVHANDGSEHAFHALSLALAVAKQNNSELRMVSVEEIDYLPEFIEEVREEAGTAARRFHSVI